MATFLGVPVMMRGRRLREPVPHREGRGRPFTAEDQDLVELLAAQAAVAIENARLYQSAKRWSRQLESLHEVMRSLVEEMELDRLLELVCARLRELIGARLALDLARRVTPMAICGSPRSTRRRARARR